MLQEEISRAYVLDFKAAKDQRWLLEDLQRAARCYLIADFDDSVAVLEGMKANSNFKDRLHYFLAPKFDEKLRITAWKSNTIHSLKPQLYIGTDSDVVEQARLLGVRAALYRL